MTTEDIRAELQQNIDEKYRAFHASLVPGIGTFLGVRVPKMREIAKKAAKEDYQTFFAMSGCSVRAGARVEKNIALWDEGATLAALLELDLGKTDGSVIREMLQ